MEGKQEKQWLLRQLEALESPNKQLREEAEKTLKEGV